MKLKCDVCGSVREYESDKKAWLDGWDVMIVAGCQVTSCSDCPVDSNIFKNENGSNPGSTSSH